MISSRARRLAKGVIPKRYWPGFVIWFVRIKYYSLFFIYSGRQVQCPFCGGRFRRFLPDRSDIPVLKEKNIAGGAYEFALCPRCHSSFRERLMVLFLKENTTIFQDALKVLHIAPERNLQKTLRGLSNLTYVSADLYSPLAAVRIDITNILYDDNAFDVIICNHVLEHIVDDRKAMSELFRVLKPGGWAILQVPISLSSASTFEDTAVSPGDREEIFGQSDHVRIYGQDYKDRLTATGFLVQVRNFASEFGKANSHRYGLQEKEDLYICFKQAGSSSSGLLPGRSSP